MDGDREHELMCAVARSRELLSIINREHHPTDLYKALRAIQFELNSMAQLLPGGPLKVVQRNPAGRMGIVQALPLE